MTEPTFITLVLAAGIAFIFIGGIAWFVESRNKNKAVNARLDRLQ